MRRVCCALIYLYLFSGNSNLGAARNLDLNPKNFKEVTFDGVTPTIYKGEGSGLSASVNKSASALIMAYDKIHKISGLSLQWQLKGKLKTTAKNERTKDGDDFPFRLGLVISGEAPWVPFFAPAWIKTLRDYLKLPTNLMMYYVAGSHSKANERWDSPYSDSIKHIALSTSPQSPDGWYQSEASFSPVDTVGIWLMADGDNSQSEFKVRIRKVQLIGNKSPTKP